MIRNEFGPIMIVISRDEVLRQDISGPLGALKSLLASRETIRANQTNIDISFSGYENTREELFEIPEVRNYVYALDSQFPFWLYFLSRYFLGLQCLTYCHLLPYLTPEARAKLHPQKFAELIENRWGPALFQLCSAAGHDEDEADALLESAMEYFTSCPSKLVEGAYDGDHEGEEDDDDHEDEADEEDFRTLLALESSQKFVRESFEIACRAAMARPDQNPHSLLLGALFLRAVLSLPVASDQFAIKLSWRIKYDESWGQRTITIGGGELSFATIEAFNSGMGWDHESTVDWSVDESSQQGFDEWVLEDALATFANDISDLDCEVSFSTDCDHAYDDITDEPTDWNSAFARKEK